jgi:hypothetical protein
MTQAKLVYRIYNENIDKIELLINQSKYPKTFQALKNFYYKIDDIKRSLVEIEKINSFYTSQALSRILYEHFLVAYYIWTKCRIDKNDSCASDYLEYYPLFELMKRDNYNAKLENGYDSKKTSLQNFLISNPEFIDTLNPITEEDVKDINHRANKFDIRIILKYMQNDLDPNDAFNSFHIIIHDVCKRYNAISSYVHGGRLADLQTFENSPITDKLKILRENTQYADVFCYQILSLKILLIATENKDGFEIYKPIYDFMNSKNK